MDENLMPLAKFARQIRAPQWWLKQECDAGRLPHIKAGSSYLVNPAAVREKLAARAAEGDAISTAHARRDAGKIDARRSSGGRNDA